MSTPISIPADERPAVGFPGGATLLLCVYVSDNAQLFAKALASALTCAYPLEKAVIVVDGPIGEALEAVLANYGSAPGVDIVRLSRNVGLAAALNAGIER